MTSADRRAAPQTDHDELSLGLFGDLNERVGDVVAGLVAQRDRLAALGHALLGLTHGDLPGILLVILESAPTIRKAHEDEVGPTDKAFIDGHLQGGTPLTTGQRTHEYRHRISLLGALAPVGLPRR